MVKASLRLTALLALLLAATSYPFPLPQAAQKPALAEAQTVAHPGPSPAGTSPLIAPSPSPTPTPVPEEVNPALAKLRSKIEPPPKPREPAVELPRRLKIPAVGIDAGVEFVGLTADGTMDAPKDSSKVAWYRLGPKPGERGNAVLAGHVDWGGKTAVFWRLNELKPGDLVEVTAVDDRKYQFVVQSQQWFDADGAPVEDVFGQADSPQLTLITCGGVFDRKTRQYLSRLVVRAVLR